MANKRFLRKLVNYCLVDYGCKLILSAADLTLAEMEEAKKYYEQNNPGKNFIIWDFNVNPGRKNRLNAEVTEFEEERPGFSLWEVLAPK